MLREVEASGLPWPELTESEMENLIAFLDFRLRIRNQDSPGLPKIRTEASIAAWIRPIRRASSVFGPCTVVFPTTPRVPNPE